MTQPYTTESVADVLASHLRDLGIGVALTYTALRLATERASDALTAERAAVRARHAAELAALDMAEAGAVTALPSGMGHTLPADHATVRAAVLAALVSGTSHDASLTAGALAKLTGFAGGDVSSALAHLSRKGFAATVQGTRRWYAVSDAPAIGADLTGNADGEA